VTYARVAVISLENAGRDQQHEAKVIGILSELGSGGLIMDRDKAISILGLSEPFSRTDIQQSFRKRTKSAHSEGQDEEAQKKLNIARDLLSDDLDQKEKMLPSIAHDLIQLNENQQLIIKQQLATSDLRSGVKNAERRTINRIHVYRDFAGTLAACSAGVVFLKENIAEIMQFPVLSPTAGSALLIASALCSLTAFMAHHRAKRVSQRTDELNRVLTRHRTIERILNFAFDWRDFIYHFELEERIAKAVEQETDIKLEHQSSMSGERRRAIDPLGMLDQEVKYGFLEDYVEYLLASEHIVPQRSADDELIYIRKSAET
jgi:hypothetical protein